MKKILYTLITALMLISCQDDMIPSSQTTEEGLVTLNVSLQVPDMKKSESRAFGETDLDYMATRPLQMVVFDGNGYLREWLNVITADEASAGTIGIYGITKGTDQINFTVQLSKAVTYRSIHFIVNSPQDDYEFGDEATLISNLSVALDAQGKGQDAYWQRLEFPNGIDENTTMNRVPMIRNFAKITVENKDTDFTYKGFAVVNVWDKGTVAPYKGNGVFASLNSGESMNGYTAITKDGYEGIWPSDAELVYNDPSKVNTDDHPLITNATDGTLTPFYMYERRNTYVSEDIPATYLLINGTYNGGDYWYKLDLVYDVDANGDKVTSTEQEAVRKQYYNILRNFHYQVSIDDVSGPGYGSPEEAAKHAAGNNLSGSIDIRDLTNISDAVNRLFVSYTDTTLVNNGTVTVRYKYIPSSANDPKTNEDVTITELTAGTEVDRMTSYTKADTDDADGWRTVSVTFANIPTNWDVITNTLGFNIKGLTREVDFNLRKKMYMIVECDPLKIPLGVKEKVAANILIPTEITGETDLYQFFPLEFLVEAEELTLSPDVATNKTTITLSPYEMPVESGTSIIPSKKANNRQTFRYKRTITNAEYQKLPTKTVTVTYNGESINNTYKIIPCHFLTNTSVSASKVYAENKYFTLIKEGFFVNGDTNIGMLTLNNGDIYGSGQQVTVSFTPLADGTYTITPTNMKAAEGTSTSVPLKAGEEYTGTFLANDWGSDVSATVTLDTETATASSTRNKLPMTATTTYNGTALSDGTLLKVYTTEANANAANDNYATTVSCGDLNSGTSAVIEGLESTSTLWFVYEDNDYIYVASTTASALEAGTANLVFEQKEKPLAMSATFDSNTKLSYNKSDETITLTFTTNKAGTYTLSSPNSSLSFTSVSGTGATLNGNTLTIVDSGVNTNIAITCTTVNGTNVNLWEPVEAQIALGEESVSAQKARTKLTLGTNTFTNGGNNDRDVTIATTSGNSATITARKQGNGQNQYHSFSGEIELEGITSSSDVLTLTFTHQQSTYKATATAQALVNGGTLSFQKQ